MPGIQETLAALTRYPKPMMPLGPRRPTKLFEVRDFGANPGDLRMFAYKPQTLAKGAPLVVVLHGCTQTAEGYAEGAGWIALADRYGFAMICPQQRLQNNPNLCFNWFNPDDTTRGHGEAESIRWMIARSLADRHLDPGRVFITGLSAGGAMTSVMLAAYPELFAAGAVVAGLPYGAAGNVQEAFLAMSQSPSRPASDWGDRVRAASGHAGPWPKVSVWHGDSDTTVRAGNADAIALQWGDVHGLPNDPVETDLGGGVRRKAWADADGLTMLESITLAGMGHGTPVATAGADGYGVAGPFLIEAGISSSLEIARFWGIVGTSAQAAEPAAARMDRTAPLRTDPSNIIVRALRAAGLMK